MVKLNLIYTFLIFTQIHLHFIIFYFHIQEGDRVFVCLPENGGYAQYVKCKKNYVFPLADTLTFGQGAGLYIPYFTAYRALVTK